MLSQLETQPRVPTAMLKRRTTTMTTTPKSSSMSAEEWYGVVVGVEKVGRGHLNPYVVNSAEPRPWYGILRS